MTLFGSDSTHLYHNYLVFIGSFADTDPTLNFIVYIPTVEEHPLYIHDEKGKMLILAHPLNFLSSIFRTGSVVAETLKSFCPQLVKAKDLTQGLWQKLTHSGTRSHDRCFHYQCPALILILFLYFRKNFLSCNNE